MTEPDQGRDDGRDPIDEDAVWAEIVAGYGKEPADPPGVWPDARETDRTDTVDRVPSTGSSDGDDEDRPPSGSRPDGDTLMKPGGEQGDEEERSNGSAHEYASAQWSGQGPRDWGPDEEEEGHFIPPDPPPLPPADLSTKMAWISVLGGPLLLFGTVLLQRPVTWWIATLGIGGFLGGFAALVSGMRDDRDEDWRDPGSGAVV